MVPPCSRAILSVTDLIEERAVGELAQTLPAKAKLEIRIGRGMIKEGTLSGFWMILTRPIYREYL